MIKSFRQRQAASERQEHMARFSLTDRLLAQILIELMELRGHRGHAALTRRLKMIGLSRQEIAALLDTTPESLAVSESRAAELAKVDAP